MVVRWILSRAFDTVVDNVMTMTYAKVAINVKNTSIKDSRK